MSLKKTNLIGLALGGVLALVSSLSAQASFTLTTPVAGDVIGASTSFSALNVPSGSTILEVCLFDTTTGAKLTEQRFPATGSLTAGQANVSGSVSFVGFPSGTYDFGIVAGPSLTATNRVRVTIPAAVPTPSPTPSPTPTPTPTPVPPPPPIPTPDPHPAIVTLLGQLQLTVDQVKAILTQPPPTPIQTCAATIASVLAAYANGDLKWQLRIPAGCMSVQGSGAAIALVKK